MFPIDGGFCGSVMLPTQSWKPVSRNSSQERNFLLQRPGRETGSFGSIAGAETALTREFGRHVFEIAALLRVSQRLYNYSVWVVGVMGIELVTPSLLERKLRPKRFPTMVVGHAIAALEARHETKLFDRIGRRIALTEAGRVFLMEARAFLARAGAAELALSEFGTLKRGTLCVQASQTIAGYWLPRHLVAFQSAFPALGYSALIRAPG